MFWNRWALFSLLVIQALHLLDPLGRVALVKDDFTQPYGPLPSECRELLDL
jgi:hypothetical protein